MVFRTCKYKILEKPDTQSKFWKNIERGDIVFFEIDDLGSQVRGGRSSIYISIVNVTKNETTQQQVGNFKKVISCLRAEEI